MFSRGDGIKDGICAALFIHRECRIAMLHLVSGSMIPQKCFTQRHSLGRKPGTESLGFSTANVNFGFAIPLGSSTIQANRTPKRRFWNRMLAT